MGLDGIDTVTLVLTERVRTDASTVAGVDVLVILQVRTGRERTAAEVTRERFLPGVSAKVVVQVGRVVRPIAAELEHTTSKHNHSTSKHNRSL